jgi:hypothetical protein
MQSLENIKHATTEQIIKGKQIARQDHPVKISVQAVSQAVWRRPAEGELKLNVDGAFVAQTLEAVAGMIMRRSDGTIVFSACRVLSNCTSALEAEMLACLDGVRFATDMGLDRILVESDCQVLVNVLTGDDRDGSPLCHLVEDLHIMLSSGRFLNVIKIPRPILVRRNWQGSPKCCFCHHDETIKHLFFQCQFARSIWSAIQVASRLSPPRSVANILGNWLHGIDNRDRVHIRVGAIALIWSLWLCRNNMVFDAKISSPMQVIYQCAHLLREWSTLQKPEHRDLYMEVCSRLEQVAKEIFTQHGWHHRLRIQPPRP